MWDNLLQGAGPNTAASASRPTTGGSASCPQEDKFWSDPGWSFLRDAFLKKAVEHLALTESDDSGTGSDGPGVFFSANHLGGTEGGLPQMAVPWSFNQSTPQSRVFGGGTWPGPGSGIWHGDNYTGKGAGDLDLLALSFEGALYSVCLVSGISMRYKHVYDASWALIHSANVVWIARRTSKSLSTTSSHQSIWPMPITPDRTLSTGVRKITGMEMHAKISTPADLVGMLWQKVGPTTLPHP